MNPKFTRFSHAMASKENESLSQIREEIETRAMCKPICFIYDGAIFEARTEEEKTRIEECIQELERKISLTVAVL